ncbi:MAG: Ku protein [Thermaerobacterales bacterium]
MRSIWKGSISFGLVYIPVRLYTATEDRRISFNLLHRQCGSRVKYLKWCSHCDVEVPNAGLVKGYEHAPGEYVVLEDQDLEDLPLATARTIEIEQFVRLQEVDPVYYQRTYLLEPIDGGARAYHLLRAALQRSDRAGIARVAIRSKETLACIRVFDQRTMVMETMHYADEVRDPGALPNFPAAAGAVDEGELDLALHLVERLEAPFAPGSFDDRYRIALQERIEARIQGRQITAAPAESRPVHDLMEALRASLAADQKNGDRHRTADDHVNGRPRQPLRAQSPSTPGGR